MAGFELITAAGQGAYYFEDLAALSQRPVAAEDRWTLPGVTAGFRFAREVAEVVSVGIIGADGVTAWGDCVGVSYGGQAGRAPVLRVEALQNYLAENVAPALRGVFFSTFREAAQWVAGQDYLPSVAYGLSQAFLVHFSGTRTATETLCAEWDLPLPTAPVALHGSCGSNRFENADTMIVNRLAVLPHTQVEEPFTQFGGEGQVILEYAQWLVRRLAELAPDSYRPSLHFDVHGAWGKVFGASHDREFGFAEKLLKICNGYPVTVESPYVESNLESQVEAFHSLRRRLKEKGLPLGVAVDEWANSPTAIQKFISAEAVDEVHIKMPTFGSLHNAIEAVRLCQRHQIRSLLGGSCIETDLSAKLTVHLALAFRPDATVVKPGMGINEGLSLMRNEMSRTLAQINFRTKG